MPITLEKLDAAVRAGIITEAQARQLAAFLQASPNAGPVFGMTHVLYYFGGLVAIGAMSLFMTLGWENFGGFAVLAIALLYACAGVLLTNRFDRAGHAIPAGICATFVVALTPLAIYGFLHGMGWWPADAGTYHGYHEYHHFIRSHWLYMELGTLAAGAAMLFRYRHPFMVMPVAIALWYMSMDIAAMIAGEDYVVQYHLHALVSLWFGLLMTLCAFWVDVRSRRGGDYAFWLYLFGVLTFWCGLTMQDDGTELTKFFYGLINLTMILIGVGLMRRVFVLFGGLGVCLYLGYLAAEVFRNSVLFPVSLTAIGLGIIWLGLLWQRHERQWTSTIRAHLPLPLRELLDARTD